MDAKELLMSSLVIEGHRDVYEQLYRTSIGEKSPIRDAVAPRLIRDGINMTVYAISGDSYSHSQNTGRYLETALDQIDQFLEEAPRSEGMIQMVKTRGDLPEKVEPGSVKFLLHFEGCMPLRESIHNLRNFYRFGLRSLQPVWNFRNELGDGVWENRTGGGLTNFGVEVIKEANRLGMPFQLYSQPDFKSMKQAKGKRFAISRFGSLTDFLTRATLRHFGVDEKEVTILQIGSTPARFAALAAKGVDASVVWFPVTEIAKSQGFNKLLDLKDIFPEWPYETFAARESYLTKEKDQVAKFLRAYQKGVRYTRDNKNDAVNIMPRCVPKIGVRFHSRAS